MTDGPRGEGDEPQSWHAELRGGRDLRQGTDALATLLSAMLVFGLPSWWLSEALGWRWVLPVGLVLGMGAGIAAVWIRYGVDRT